MGNRQKWLHVSLHLFIFIAFICLTACQQTGAPTSMHTPTPTNTPAPTYTPTPTSTPTPTYTPTPTNTPTPTYTPTPTNAPSATPTPLKAAYVICIDPGHQATPNSEEEPIGPDSTTMKRKTSAGTRGVVTQVYEYELNLEISLMLQKILETAGFNVVMTRTTNDVNLSNAERAIIANEAKADIFIRIHANSNDKPHAAGAETICINGRNKYHPEVANDSKFLSECILNEYCKATGLVQRELKYSNEMSGLNWSAVPSTIIEMGFMTNEEEDILMQNKEFQERMVDGIVNGIYLYLGLQRSVE